jgi:6-phosphofructokinase 2
MIATITVNPCIDLSLTVDDLVKDDASRVREFKKYAGGKGICVSRVLRRLGEDSLTITMLGGHAGREVRHLLDKEGVRTWVVALRAETRTNIIIYEKDDRSLTRLHMRGPSVERMELEELEGLIRGLPPRTAYVALGGSLLPGFPDDFYARVTEQLRERGMKVVLDSDEKDLRIALDSKPYMIKPNRFELSRLVGRDLGTRGDILDAARGIVDRGVNVVVVSLGAEGALAVTSDVAVEAEPPPIQDRKSTVGSGDSLVAAMLFQLIRGGEDLGEILAFGVAAGTATALTPGTELCYPDDVYRLVEKVKVRKLSE